MPVRPLVSLVDCFNIFQFRNLLKPWLSVLENMFAVMLVIQFSRMDVNGNVGLFLVVYNVECWSFLSQI